MKSRTSAFLYTGSWCMLASVCLFKGLSAWSSQTKPQPDSTIWHSGFAGLILLLLCVGFIWGGYELGVRVGHYRRLGWGQRFIERHFPEPPDTE